MKLLIKLIWNFILQILSYLEYVTPSLNASWPAQLSSWAKGRIVRLEATLFLTFLFSPIVYLKDLLFGFVFPDIVFVKVLFFLFGADLFTGMRKHWKLHDFSFKALCTGFAEKLFLVWAVYIVCNAVTQITELQEYEQVVNGFRLLSKLVISVYIGGSAFNNVYVISGGRFPPLGWMKRMRSFNITGNPSDLTGDQNQNAAGPIADNSIKP